MALELLVEEAKGMSEESLMEVLRFMRFIKIENRHEHSLSTDGPVVREAGKYRGQIVMSDDFNEPLEEFREYI